MPSYSKTKVDKAGRLFADQVSRFAEDMVETLSREALPGLKFGRGPADVRKFLFDYAEIVAQEDLGLASSEETLDRVKERVIEAVKLRFGHES